ncbi:Uncharacterized protein FWK35_00000565, partial [Aphis craccivora]
MLCFFICVSVYTRKCQNNAFKQFQTLVVVSDSKMNLVGALGSTGKNRKKIKEKREFLRKTSFRPNRFFYMDVIQKLITVNT